MTSNITRRIQVKNSKIDRALYWFPTLSGPPLVLGLLFLAVALVVKRGPGELTHAAIYLLIGVGCVIISIILMRYAIQTAWFRAQFLICDDRIEMRLPHDRVKVGLWKDLVCAPESLVFLGFADGTYMNTTTLWRKLKPKQVDQVLSFVGTGSPLPVAWREAKRKNREMFKLSNRVLQLILLGFSMMLAGAATGLTLQAIDSFPTEKTSFYDELAWQIFFLGAIGICVIIASVVIKRLISIIRHEREFHRDYPS